MALSPSRWTAFVESTQDILDFTKTRLSATTDMGDDEIEWSVEIFPGTNYDELFTFIPELGLPCAAVVYGGSDWQNQPRRALRVSVVVACQSFSVDDNDTLSALIDQAVSLCDRQISNQALWEVESDQGVDLGPGIAAALITFNVEDH